MILFNKKEYTLDDILSLNDNKQKDILDGLIKKIIENN